jgi:diadenosine tetraphosphate (Ap4A) HIT family hydrolase
MSARLTWIAVVAVFASTTALADPPTGDKKPTQASSADDAARTAKRQYRALMADQNKRAAERAAIFAKIAVKHDYSGEWVVFRDNDVTAFLDLKDPQHPRYSPHAGDEPKGSTRRAHILVVPNQPREHIGKTLTSDIGADDLDATLTVFHAAEALAKRLNITNPKIYIKAAEKVGIGYLHVHIEGDRDPKVPYPQPLKPPPGG